MRKQDKLKNIQEINKRMNEGKFGLDNPKTNEGDEPNLNEFETSDVTSSTWFSDEDGERLTDKIEP